MSNIKTKDFTKIILLPLFVAVLMLLFIHIPVHAVDFNCKYAVGDTVAFFNYGGAGGPAYKWEVTSGSDCVAVKAGLNDYKCVVQFTKTGSVTLKTWEQMSSGNWFSPDIYYIEVVDPSVKTSSITAEVGALGQSVSHYIWKSYSYTSSFVNFEWKAISGGDCVNLNPSSERVTIRGNKAGTAVIQGIATLKDKEKNTVPGMQYIHTIYVTVTPSKNSNNTSSTSSKAKEIANSEFCPYCGGTGLCEKCYGARTTHCDKYCKYCASGFKTGRNGKTTLCTICRGTGNCQTCRGTGKITCNRCNGTGKCTFCKGNRLNPYFKGKSSKKNSVTGTKANPLTIKVSSKTYKRSALNKKKSFKIGASNAKGKVTYTLNKKAKKAKIKVNKKGKVTIPKKCKKGTYKIVVKAAGNSTYAPASKTVTIKVK